MPTVQSTYADNIDASYAGAIANQEPRTLISRTVEDSGGILFGYAAMQGTNDKGCVISDGTGFIGITVRTQSVEDGSFEGFEYQDEARIMKLGTIYVSPSDAVVAGEQVEIDSDGRLTGAGHGDWLINNARWETSAAADGLAQLQLGSPHSETTASA